MIITKIELENIRSYKKESLTFPKGIVLLSGDIGSGKSTLLLAIEFALFGILRGEVDAQALLRHDSQRGSVTLTCTINKQVVCIQRKLVRTKNGVTQETGELIVDGTSEQLSATELKARVLNLLAYPIDHISKSKSLIYRYTVYTSQEQMKHILFDASDVRLATLRTVFGIDKYKTVADNVSVALKDMRSRNQFLQGLLTQLTQIKEEVTELKQKITQEKERETLLKEKQTQLQSQLAIIQKKKEECDAKKVEYAALQGELRHLKDAILSATKREEETTAHMQTVSQKMKAITPIPFNEEVYISLTAELKKATLEQKAKQKELLTLTSKLASAQQTRQQLSLQLKDIKLKQREKEQYKKQIDEIQIPEQKTTTDALISELARIEATLTDANTRITQLSQADTCPLCTQNITHEHKNTLVMQSKAQIQSAQDTQITIQKKIQEAQVLAKSEEEKRTTLLQTRATLLAKIESISTEEEKLANIENDMLTIFDTIESTQKQITQLEQSSLQETCEQLQQKINDMQAAKNSFDLIQSYKDQLSRCLTDLDTIKTELAKNIERQKGVEAQLRTINSSEFEKIRTEYDTLKVSLDTVLTNYSISKERLSTYQKQYEKVMQTHEQLTLHQTQQQTLEQQMQWLSAGYLPALSTIEQTIFSSIHREFSVVFSKWFMHLIEDEAFQVRLDSNFTPIISQNGYEMDVAHLSGGERTAVALAYRLALNHVINDVLTTIQTKGLLILDEPTDGFSSEQLDRVHQVLAELQLNQIILVSHEQKLQSFANHTIHITKKESVSSIS